jgi:hypothetical protein
MPRTLAHGGCPQKYDVHLASRLLIETSMSIFVVAPLVHPGRSHCVRTRTIR